VTNVFLTPSFDAPDPSGEPGACANWTRTTYQKYPGFAAFGQPLGFIAVNERFQWESRPAQIVGTSGAPFALPTSQQWTLTVAAVSLAPLNVIRVAGADLRSALPPGASFYVTGPEMAGYWTTVRVDLAGGNSFITVSEDVLAFAPGARCLLAPVLECTPCEHAYAPSVVDTTAYPVGPIVAGQTLIVRVDRGAPQTVAFQGGETAAADVATLIDEVLVGGGARVTAAGQVEVFSDTRGPGGFVQIEAGTAPLTFDVAEARGRGQWAQPWPAYFASPGAATTEEVAEVLEAHWHHAQARSSESVTSPVLRLRTDREGSTATLAVDDARGGIHDAAAWPVAPAPLPILDTINFTINGSLIIVSLLPTDTTPDLVAARIDATFSAGSLDATATHSADRVYVDSPQALACVGGTANAYLNFPTTWTAYGGGGVAATLGMRTATAGVDDVGWPATFADVTAIYGEFAGGTVAAGTAELFDWREWADAGTVAAGGPRSEFASWYDKLVGTPPPPPPVAPVWPDYIETFDDGWGNEWLSSYAAGVATPGAWKPPGVTPGARIVGRPLTFPVTILANRARMAIYSETDATWYVLALTPGTYATQAQLHVELTARLAACGITDDLNWGFDGDALTLGWNGAHPGSGAVHLGAPRGIFLADQDARPTLGLWPLAADPGAARVAVPAGFYAGDPVAAWDTDDAYGVDPFSRLVFAAVQDPALGTWFAPCNGDLPALFNTLAPAIPDAYAEAFAWWTPIAGGAYVGWPLATFDATIAPETFEDFEEGW
jgi:hypothetical protein